MTWVNLLRARPCGAGFIAACPAHDDKNPSLSITPKNGRNLFHCFSPRCDNRLLTQIMAECGVIDSNAQYPRHWGDRHPWEKFSTTLFQPNENKSSTPERLCNRNLARKIWSQVIPLNGTSGEIYLRGRGIDALDFEYVGFHPNLFHSGGKCYFEAIVAALRCSDSGEIQAIHRIYLRPYGKGKADIKSAKMSLGPVNGCAIQLVPVEDKLIITEGLEDALTLWKIYKIPVWACTGSNLKNVRLPDLPRAKKVIIGADNDEAGRRMALETQQKLQQEGRWVTIMYPSGAKDFNEMLVKGGFNGISPR